MFLTCMYKKIRQDFEFLEKYGFKYVYELKHYVRPSVFFSNGKSEIRIGYAYDESKIYVFYYPILLSENTTAENLLNTTKDLLDGLGLCEGSYKNQVNLVKEFLNNILNTL